MCRSRAICRRQNSPSWRCWPGRWGLRKWRAAHSFVPATMPTRWLMRREVLMPDVGAPAPVVSVWFVAPGERVYAGDRLVEILIAGATIGIAAPASGRLLVKNAWPDERVTPGQVLGYIEEEE